MGKFRTNVAFCTMAFRQSYKFDCLQIISEKIKYIIHLHIESQSYTKCDKSPFSF